MSNWLYLDSYVEITFNSKDKNCLIYNTLDAKKYIFEKLDYEILRKLNRNGYSLRISPEEQVERKELIDKFENNFLGGIIESEKKPFIFYPLTKVQRSLKKNQKVLFKNEGFEIADYLFELSIHIDGKNELLANELKKIIKEVENANLIKLNVFIENLQENRKEIFDFISSLDNDSHLVNVHIGIADYTLFRNDFLSIESNSSFKINVVIEYGDTVDSKIFCDKNIRFLFDISNELSYNFFSSIVEDKDVDYTYRMDFLKCDSHFLDQYVAMDKADIEDIKISKREYDANKVLNKNLFGKIVIHDNKIYPGLVKDNPIAILNDDITMKEVLFKAITKSQEWFLTRSKVKPCKSCLYRYICPPISENELRINKYNLCRVLN